MGIFPDETWVFLAQNSRMKPFWLAILLLSSLLVSCDYDNSTFPVDFNSDSRILQGSWKGFLKEHFDLESLTHSPSKNLLAGINYGYSNAQILIFNASNGSLVKTIALGSQRCLRLKFQPQGPYLTCQHTQGWFKVWNVETWQAREIILRGPPNSTTELAPGGEFLYNYYFELSGSEQIVHLQLRSLETNLIYKNIVVGRIKTNQRLRVYHIDPQVVVYSLSDQDGLKPIVYLYDQNQGSSLVLSAPHPWCDSRNNGYFISTFHVSPDGSQLGTTLDDVSSAVVVWNTRDGSITKQFVQANCDASFRLAGFTGSGMALEDHPNYPQQSLLYWNPEQGFHNPIEVSDYYGYLFQGDSSYGYWFTLVRFKQPGGMAQALQKHTTQTLQWTHQAENYSISLNLQATFVDNKTYTFSGSGTSGDGKTWMFSGKGFANRDHLISQRTGCDWTACPQPMSFIGTLSHPELGSFTLRGTTPYGSTDQITSANYSVSTISSSNKQYFFSIQK